ncbi:MAG: PAAR-like protein, partial [Cyanobacteria bacterium J06636_27]
MPQQVCMGASLQCAPFGTSPSSLIVIPKGLPVTVNRMLAATIMDFAPIVNIGG